MATDIHSDKAAEAVKRQETADTRAEWQRPAVERLEAKKAESGLLFGGEALDVLLQC
jgi:hypothetical protein